MEPIKITPLICRMRNATHIPDGQAEKWLCDRFLNSLFTELKYNTAHVLAKKSDLSKHKLKFEVIVTECEE